MTPWSAFFDLLSPDVPGCPQAAQIIALRQAGIDFCEQSLAWKYDHPDLPVVANTATYLYDPPEGAVVHAVTWAEFNERELDVGTMERDIEIWNWRNITRLPDYLLGGSTFLTLVPSPDVDGTLKLKVVLKPSPDADGIDDDIFNEYREAIVHGALAKLMISPKKPYSDAGLAQFHAHMFLIKTAKAGVRGDRNHNRSPLRTLIMRR